MARKLDFIVFGVPRSGTKALVRALNLHPHVYCAMERFHFRADHSRLTFPDSFLDASVIGDRDNAGKIEVIAVELAEKPEVLHAGNKLPRYYFALDRINREVPALKNIWIYRSPYGFMQSWNAGSSIAGADSGRPARSACLACSSFFVASRPVSAWARRSSSFPTSTDLTAPTARCGRRWTRWNFSVQIQISTLRKPSRRSNEAAGSGSSAAGGGISHRLPLRDYEEEILDALQMKQLDAIMDQGRAVRVSEIAAPLRDFLGRAASVLPEAMDRAFIACDNHAVPSFGREYFQRNRAELSSLIKLACGSKALTGFQRYGAYQRLKSLYAQRWALRRRFGGTRV
jgi:Sulfotransferase family